MKTIFARFLPLLFFSFTINQLCGQTPTYGDCLGALPICDSIHVEMISPEDAGNFINELHEDCCIEEEQNSIWYTFKIKSSGLMGFTIIPEEDDFDYDWCLFNITDNPCGEIANDFNMIASCNAAGGTDGVMDCYGETGPNGGSDFYFQNLNCGTFPPTLESEGYIPFNDYVNVVEGEIYALLILEFTEDVQNGFIIDFTYGDDVGIYDEDRPNLVSIDYIYEDCTITGFDLIFDEEIVCSSINYDDIGVTVDNVSVNGEITESDCNEAAYSTEFRVILDAPVAAGEILNISSNTDPFDLCINPIFEFEFSEQILMVDDTIVEDFQGVCEGEFAELEVDLSGQFESVEWSTNETTASINVAEGFYEAVLKGPCADRVIQFEVGTVDIPDVDILAPISFCNEPVDIEISASGDYEYEINGTSYSIENVPELAAGNYSIIVSDGSCDTTISLEVFAEPEDLEISGQEEYTIVQGDSIILSVSTNLPYDSIYWLEGGEVLCYDCEEVEVKPEVLTVYTVVVVDENGCVSEKMITVRIKSIYDVYVPNVFTPNDDGINDFFTLFGNRFLDEILLLEIYDRWGERVFKAENFPGNDNNYGWDGTFKSRIVASGVYSWLAKVKYTDGIEDVLVGNVTVVR